MIEYLDTIDSTSTELRRRMSVEELPHGYCISADFQTSGHGQATNRWESENGKNLLFSLLLRPIVIPAAEQFVITELVTLAIINALQDEIRQKITIKWPNDIYVGDKKLCGILIENALCGPVIDTCIVGIGININQELFVSDAPNPVSLKQLNGRDNDRIDILDEIYRNILNYYDYLADNWQNNDIKQSLHYEYMNNLYRRTGYHNYSTPEGEKFSGEIEDIGPQGHLILRLQSGEIRTFAFKEVIFGLNKSQ
jgi:BirA family biotin operon repressor/biotin-[acetyl-CoA-carboxylase] ligase